MTHNLETAEKYIIDTPELLERLFAYSKNVKSDIISYDLETDGLQEKTGRIFGVGVCFNLQKSFYIVIRNQKEELVWSETQLATIIQWIDEITKSKKLIGQNIKFDVLFTKSNFGIDLTDRVHADTQLMKHTLDEEKPFGLDELGMKELGIGKQTDKLEDSVKANGGKYSKDQKDIYKADTAIIGEYCCYDVLLTLALYNIYEVRLKQQELHDFFYKDEVMPLYREFTIPAKDKGFPVDIPYYEGLRVEIDGEITKLEDTIRNEIKEYVDEFEGAVLDEDVPVKTTGNLPKVYAEMMGIPLPVTKEGKITLSAGAIKKQLDASPGYERFYNWLLGKEATPYDVEYAGAGETMWKARLQIYLSKKDQKGRTRAEKGQKNIFNLNSGDHLGYILYEKLGIEPIKFSEKTKKPATDEEVLDELIENYSNQYEFLAKLLELRKLKKLQSTYVMGILDRQVNGYIFTDMLQYGTTSGRFSSRNPNLQNQPRIKDEESGLSPLILKYVNAIRKGFIAPKGYKIVNADFSQLEPCCFASVSGDKRLQAVFHKGEDLYARIAIDVFKLTQYSADKKQPNYLKKISPEFRNKAKVFALAVPYGAEESRISQAMSVDYKEAAETIRSYLGAYPDLRKYMKRCELDAMIHGQVKTEFGRIRHLPRAKELASLYKPEYLLDYKWAKEKGLLSERRELKGLLNNAKNFPIQGTAASIVNRAAVAIAKEFKKHNINGSLRLQVHDELTAIVQEDQAELAKDIMRECMQNTVKIAVPLVAEPLIADNWGEAK